ncbi:hypothetical protein ACF0H5_000941 [Mactra antiquata]
MSKAYGTTGEDEKEATVSDPDEILKNIGGCGRFQLRISILIHLIKTVVCFAFYNLLIFTKVNSWSCDDNIMFERNHSITFYGNVTTNITGFSGEKSCVNINGTQCQKYRFDESLNDIVNEFDLVCKKDFVPTLVASINIFGVLVGNFVGGQLADLIGRKIPFFASLLLLFTMHLVGYFSTSWQMFAVATFFVGMGGGFFLTTQYCLLAEFTLSKWRSWIVGFPSWPIQACLMSMVAWLLHDWRYMQLLTGLMAVPCLLAWFWIPESFRWYISHDKIDKAEAIINDIAKVNGKTTDGIHITTDKQTVESKDGDRRYTVLDLFKSRELTITTLLLMFVWGSMGVTSYGIGFGIQTLSGNIYFNTFLFSLFSIPSKGIAIFLQNRFGRRLASIICYGIVAGASLTIGVVQTLNLEHKDSVTNVLAIIANTAVSASWGPVQTMTLELYPTVIRNISFGSHSVIGRAGAILGPQLVYLNSYFEGLLFYICGAISLLCVFALFFLRETMDQHLEDKLSSQKSEKVIDKIVDDSNVKEDVLNANGNTISRY